MERGKRLYFNRVELRHWLEEGSIKPGSAQEKQAQALSRLRPRRRKLRY